MTFIAGLPLGDTAVVNQSARIPALLVLLTMVLDGCAGAMTFHQEARAGDTVALAAGWEHNFTHQNTTVTITPSLGAPIVYAPNDPAIRAVVNLYPDPVSSILVSAETGQDLTQSAQLYNSLLTSNYTNGDKDWWQTTIFVDLPATLPTGTATISVSNPTGESASSTVNIVDGTGTSNIFDTVAGPLNTYQLASLERVTHYTIYFTGNTIPYAIQVDLSHSADVNHGGVGMACVINPRGDLKNVSWSDTGVSLRAILMPAKGQALSAMLDYKFYVAGGITNLNVVDVKAFDINGNPVAGITASVK